MTRLDLGVGLALMPGLLDELDSVRDLVDCLEVEPQTFWLETGDFVEPFRVMDNDVLRLRASFEALLAHGVSAPVGGSQPPGPEIVRLFEETVRLLGARMASEHLAFNQALGADGTFGSAFFLPPRQTWSGVEAAAAAIGVLRAGLTVPFLVETPVSYLRPRPDEVPDGAFVAAVAEHADCGILLDLHNIWTNQRNGRQDVHSFVAQLPLERVWEVHLAGGMDRRGYWLDAHSGGLHPELLALAEEVLPLLPDVRAVVYEILPEFVTQDGRNVMRADLESVQRLVAGHRWTRGSIGHRSKRGCGLAGQGPALQPASHVADCGEPATLEPSTWEHVLASLAIGRMPTFDTTLTAELAADPAIPLLRELVGAGRSGRVASSLPLTVGLLLSSIGMSKFENLLHAYAAQTTPALWGSEEGRRFAEWVSDRFESQPLVRAALRLDLAALDSVRTNCPQVVELDVDPIRLIAAVHSDDVPDSLPSGRYLVTVGGGSYDDCTSIGDID